MRVVASVPSCSIVLKVTYEGHSVLLGGDSIGRRRGDAADACKDAEAQPVAWHDAGKVDLESDVIIAPHHGADNGSSSRFIEAVDPTFVVFSAGSSHRHPTYGAVARYTAAGVTSKNMFRTDRGDDEKPKQGETLTNEYKDGNTKPGCRDKSGDDDVEIVLPKAGPVDLAYRKNMGSCE